MSLVIFHSAPFFVTTIHRHTHEHTHTHATLEGLVVTRECACDWPKVLGLQQHTTIFVGVKRETKNDTWGRLVNNPNKDGGPVKVNVAQLSPNQNTREHSHFIDVCLCLCVCVDVDVDEKHKTSQVRTCHSTACGWLNFSVTRARLTIMFHHTILRKPERHKVERRVHEPQKYNTTTRQRGGEE